MVLRILEKEQFLDKFLYQFLLNGPRNPDYSEEAPAKEFKLPWLNTKTWGDLKSLSMLHPFTYINLILHMKEHSHDWDNFYN
mmetsp:Transcript_7295/g.6466  ORF Transcript_7295/g.6466 Transcript_7295/m.6466 type:complete len:82 (+) Transcript_7295:3304-3549(+)